MNGGWQRFSSPSVVLTRTDLLTEARQLAAEIRKLKHPRYIAALDVYPEKLLGGSKTRALAILKKAFAWSLQTLGNDAQPKRDWSLRITDTSINEALVQYIPDTGVLEMQRKTLEVFREVDMVVVAVHELAGHHMQESNVLIDGDRTYYMSERTNTQEGCAMACERTLLTGPLERAGLEWKLYRTLRALEDSGVTTAWDEFPEGHRMPRAYVRHFVEELPGRAQHYVFMANDRFCEC